MLLFICHNIYIYIYIYMYYELMYEIIDYYDCCSPANSGARPFGVFACGRSRKFTEQFLAGARV